ncbi:MAG: hypothetical protein ACTSVU_01115 [Promethearchaeota archaeon]
MSLFNYISKRILALVPIVFGVMFLTFVLSHFMPGNPYLIKLGEHSTASQIEWYNIQVERMGLNKPILDQFWTYFTNSFGPFFSYLIIGILMGMIIFYIIKIIIILSRKIQVKRKLKKKKMIELTQNVGDALKFASRS